MQTTSWRQHFYVIALCTVAFAISMPFMYGSIAVMLLITSWLVQGGFPQKLKKLANAGYLVWILYYVLHAISYCYSEDKGESSFDLTSKLSFILMPLVIGTGPSVSGRNLEKICFNYVMGITASSIYCVGKAVILYAQTKDPNLFFYHTLVKGLETNAVYIAWFTIFSLFLLLLFKWDICFKGKSRIWRWIIFALQMLFFILLSSRLLLVLFFVLIIPFGYKIILKNRQIPASVKTGLAALLLIITGVVFFTRNPISQRYNDIRQNNFKEVTAKDYFKKDTVKFNNLTARLFIWRVGLQNIREQKLWWYGCGNGDVHDIQNRKIKELGLPDFRYNHEKQSGFYNINLHNMYLQSLIMLGIPGLLCFLTMVILPFFFFRKVENKNTFLVFQIVSALFMLQEAALQTQAGIIYFTFFSQIFWNLYYTTVKKRSIQPVY